MKANTTPISAHECATRKRKALISFISYDQDDFEFKRLDKAFIASYNTRSFPPPQNRHEIWRPSVALAQLYGLEEHYSDLLFDDYYLLADNRESHKRVRDEVADDIRTVAPNINLVVEDIGITQPFETSDVFPCLFRYFANEKFHRADTEYYVNCTSGTTQMRNCLFLLTQMGQIDARRITPTPWRNHKRRGRPKDETYREDGRRWARGSYVIEDPLEFANAYRDMTKQNESGTLAFLKHGVITKDDSKLRKIARIIDGIKKLVKREFKEKQTILITGETGVGKTQLAENIAAAFSDSRANLKFLAYNCATICGSDENIQKIELFGCKKGAANEIHEDREGAFKKADGGFLFLDEIGELHPKMQAMLLTVLDKGTFVPLGGDRSNPEKSSFQLICGTNRPLEQLVREGKFRRDLYNRINAWHFELDPLRDHREDIPANVDSILNEFYDDTQLGRPNFTPEALDRFLDFANDPLITWDGNFRELNSMVRRMAILSDKFIITEEIVADEIEEARSRYEAARLAADQPDDQPVRQPAAIRHPNTDATSHPDYAQLERLIGKERFDNAWSEELAHLMHVVTECRRADSLSDANKRLRSTRGGEAPRSTSGLSKYLGGFGLTFEKIKRFQF